MSTIVPVKDYEYFLSERGKRRKPSPIRALQPLMALPGMISLGGGLPNPSMFPFVKMEVGLRSGETVELSGKLLNDALQYSASFGLPELLELLKQDQSRQHNRAVDDNVWSICITTGSQDAIGKALDILVNDGDPIIVENPTYPGTLSAMSAMALQLVPVEIDEHGMKTDELEKLLDNWDQSKKKPKVIYTIPTGQNPSGATLSNARREHMYRIAQKHNLLIMEDDPYWHLRLKPYKADPSASQPEPLRSIWSMDTDGRVMRFDSFSKVASSGIRVGLVTGPAPIVTKIQLVQQATTLHTAGVPQAMLVALLQKWGWAGWDAHIAKVQEFYSQRRDVFLGFAEKHLTGLAEWWVPSAGMFVWFKFLGVEDSSELIQQRALHAKVLMIPGKSCSADGKPSPYARAAFSVASDADMEEALKRLAQMLREEQESRKQK
eukprot:TRINITY_DN8636_c0_g1_i1.p1 TRINITY_DN8636_c0_g1~~TRINITY_DN8636_c0_g1_i1.p1  ORF type:complete len:460 (+),score=105.71 TRINITY_DN8636_c0_g1_i1:76-1380(+)